MKRSVAEGVVVYDDDIDYPAFCRKRNVEAMEGYDEYCSLWRDFIDLKAEVRWRNKPTKDGTIPRIQTLVKDIERQREDKPNLPTKIAVQNAKLVNETDYGKKEALRKEINYLKTYLAKIPEDTKLDAKETEYKTFQTYHVALWKQMDKLIEDLAKNEYVKRRNHDNVLKLEDYKRALYDMIDK